MLVAGFVKGEAEMHGHGRVLGGGEHANLARTHGVGISGTEKKGERERETLVYTEREKEKDRKREGEKERKKERRKVRKKERENKEKEIREWEG